MEYVQMFWVVFVVFSQISVPGTNSQSLFFTSWKEPPIDSGIGEGNATVVVKENGRWGTSTGIQLQALGGTGNISYILLQGDPMYFAVGGPADDEVTIISPVDYEQLQEVTVTVIALDQGSPQKTGSAIMTIFIGDVNDNVPVFQQKTYDVTVSELADIGALLTLVSASDADGSYPNNKLSYAITGGNTDNAFSINSTSGQISIVRQLVYSKIQQYALTIIAADAGTDPHALTATTTVLINVTEVETFTSWKEPPISGGIGHGIATVKVKENGTPGTSTGIKLQVLGGNGAITYTIKDQDQREFFSIGGPNKDDVIVAAPVDFEEQVSVNLVVEAEDSGMSPKTGRAIVTIIIDDVNDNAPVFEQTHYQQNISEESVVGTELLYVNATDNDGTSPNNVVTYSLSEGNINNDFSISPKTGIITVAKQLKGTGLSAYQIKVIAVDGGTDPGPMTGTTKVSIHVHRPDDTTGSTTKATTVKQNASDRLASYVFTMLL